MNLEESQLLVQLTKEQYFPGNSVHGYIYLRTREKLEGSHLHLKFKGIEYSSWLLSPPGANQNKQNKREGKNMLYRHKNSIYRWENNFIPSGDYCFPFEFTLREGLPGSYEFAGEFPRKFSEFEAYIKYKLKAEILLPNQQKLKSTKSLVVFQKPDGSNLQHEKNLAIKFCHCFTRGETRIKCLLDKASYIYGEVAQLSCEVNNMTCPLNIEDIKVKLVRELSLTCDSKAGNAPDNSIIFPTAIRSMSLLSSSGPVRARSLANLLQCEFELNSPDLNSHVILNSSSGNKVRCECYLEFTIIYGGGCRLSYPEGTSALKVPLTINDKKLKGDQPIKFNDFNPKSEEAVPVIFTKSFEYSNNSEDINLN